MASKLKRGGSSEDVTQDTDKGKADGQKNAADTKLTYEWEEELDEYDEPDVYPSEKDYKWFEEVVTDSEEEEHEPSEAEAEAEPEKTKEEEDQREEEQPVTEESKKDKEEEKETAAGEDEEGEEEQFVLHKMEDEEEEEVFEGPTKKYKTILVRKLVERLPKVHYEPLKERIEYSKGTEMIPRPIHFIYSFGYDCQRMANLHVLDEETVVFMSGFVLTFYNHVTTKKTYLHALGGSCFGALDIHPSKKLFAAAEKGEHPLIGIWSWKKLQLFRKLNEGTEKTYASVKFSPDGRMLASQGGEPDFLITVWNWLKEMPVLRVKSHAQDVYRVTFSKELAGLLTTAGLCHIKFWKMAQTFTGLKLKGDIGRFGKTELTDIEGYVEMPDGKVVSGTEWGNLLVWENGLVVAELCISNDAPCHKGIVRFITMVDGDFYTTGQDGMVNVWPFETVDSGDIYTTEDSLKVPMKSIANLSINEEADVWSIVPDPFNQDPFSVFWFAQDGKGKIWKVDLSFLNAAKEPQPVLMSHGGPIIASATSPRTYLLATLGGDGRLNVYDYIRKTLVASRTFNAPGSCLIWPSNGTGEECCTVLCGFNDGVLRIIKISRWQPDEKESDSLPLNLILYKVCKPHRRRVTSIVIDSDAELLMTGSQDGTVFFFNVKNDFEPILYVALPGYIPVRFLLWVKPKEEDTGKKIIAVDEKGIVTQLSIKNLFNFDNKGSYFSTESNLLTYIHVKSVKSVLRRNEELERIRIYEEEKQAALEMELRRLVEQNIETQSQQDIRLLMEAEALDKDMDAAPNPKPKKWEPYIPPKPSPVFEVVTDVQESDILNITMGKYDTGYVYSVRLIPQDSNVGQDEGEYFHEPVNAIPIPDCGDVAITKIIFTASGDKAVLGFEDGRVRMVHLGLAFDIKHMKEHWTEGVHDLVRGSITSLTFDLEEMFLFSTGLDGNCFMFSTVSEIKSELYCSSRPPCFVPLLEDEHIVDIVDDDDYTLEDTKNIAKEIAMLAAARKNKAAKREEIARLRLWFSEVVRRNNELPEEVRLTPVEFTMAKDNVDRHEERMKDSLLQLQKEMAWESERAFVALNKLKIFFKDPIKGELFVLRAFNSDMTVSSFRHTNLPDFYYDAIKTYNSKSVRKTSHLDSYQEAPSDMSLTEVSMEPRPKKKPGMDKFQYQRVVRLWQRRLKKQMRKREWDSFFRTDPSGKELEDEVCMIQEAREDMGDLKLKTHSDYKAPENLRLTVNRARKRLIDLEARMHDLKGAFNEEMMQLREYKLKYIDRMNDFKSKLIANQNLLPLEIRQKVPEVPGMYPNENPYLLTSCSREEVLAYKAKQQAKAEAAVFEKTAKPKKVEPVKRRPGRQQIATQQQPEKKDLVPEKDIGSFVQVIKFPPSALEIQIDNIKLTKAKFYQDYYIECIEKEKFRFDVELKLLRHKKIKLDYYIKTAETTMVLLTEEFLQAHKGENVESKLEGIISNAGKEQKVCTLSLKSINKQIENKKRELEEINAQRASLLKEVQEISLKAPNYESYLIKVFKKKIARPKTVAKKSEDDDGEEEEGSYESDDSDDSDSLDMDLDEDADDDLDVDLPPSDLKNEIYESVIEVRARRVKIDEREDVIKTATDELIHQANALKGRISTAEKSLARTRAELDAFIFDKQNKLNSIDFAVSVRLHQIFHFGPEMSSALFTTDSIIKRLRDRIPELTKEKRMQKKQMAETRKGFSQLQRSKQQYSLRLAAKSDECDAEMMNKFGKVRPVEELDNFVLDPDIIRLRHALRDSQDKAWRIETQLQDECMNQWCRHFQLHENAATTLMVEAELTEELLEMNNCIEMTLSDLTATSVGAFYKEDILQLKSLVLKQWKTLRQLQLEIASLTWRPGKAPLPPIEEKKVNNTKPGSD